MPKTLQNSYALNWLTNEPTSSIFVYVASRRSTLVSKFIFPQTKIEITINSTHTSLYFPFFTLISSSYKIPQIF
ncbi:hypothetical protein L1887_18440 [Cichorium endivia]|nr:hypothetical protein L1887_18440 [Cichorium endivia]